MANGEWRMDDLIRFLYAILGDAFAFLKLISINVLFASSASFAVKLSFSFASLALPPRFSFTCDRRLSAFICGGTQSQKAEVKRQK